MKIAMLIYLYQLVEKSKIFATVKVIKKTFFATVKFLKNLYSKIFLQLLQ